jgi:hypothetical protein
MNRKVSNSPEAQCDDNKLQVASGSLSSVSFANSSQFLMLTVESVSALVKVDQ